MKLKVASILFIASTIFCNAYSQNVPDDIIGVWHTGGKEPAKIQIYNSAEIFYGKIIWVKNPTENGNKRVDIKNPDIAKRTNPIIGLIMLAGFKFDGRKEWKGGEIYDPESGKTYSAYMYLKDSNTIKVRGYIGVSLFGRTETWTRTN